MAYGHAERNLVLIRELEAETRQLPGSLDQLNPEQPSRLQNGSQVARHEDSLPVIDLEMTGDRPGASGWPLTS